MPDLSGEPASLPLGTRRRVSQPCQPCQPCQPPSQDQTPKAKGWLWRSPLVALTWLVASVPLSLQAQTILPDSTLPLRTLVQQSTPNGGPRLWTVTGGTPNQGGNLLFHSFLFFTLGNGETVLFDNAPTVDHIFARVTGTVASSLPGTLRSSHPTNLFLMNPRGIIMNSLTRLDLGGSFLATTGDRLLFEDGLSFDAAPANAPPLLVINPPTAIAMGNNPGSIGMTGTTHGLFFDGNLSVNRSRRATGIAVATGQHLTLVGNGITLNGANLTAPQGTVELGSVKAGVVSLNADFSQSPWVLGYDEGQSVFSPIRINTSSAIEVSGPGGGNVSLQGSTIDVLNGSTILADTLGSQRGGTLRVRGTESVTVEGTRNGFTSSLFAAVNPGAGGDGGSLEVITPQFRTASGSIIGVDTFGAGDAGMLTVAGGTVEVDQATWSVQSFSQATGRAGRIELDIETLRVINGGQVLAQSLGRGEAGSVWIRATDSVLVQGERVLANRNVLNSLITTFQDLNSAGSDEITLETGDLRIEDGGRISMLSKAQNSAIAPGQLKITAHNGITIAGTSSNGVPSLITTTADNQAQGDHIAITTPQLTIRDGGQISSGTVGSGRGGDLGLTVTGALTLMGGVPVPSGNLGGIPVFRDASGHQFPSGLFAGSTGAGSAGNLTVTAGTVAVMDQAEMTVSSDSTGNAGTLTLKAAAIDLQNQGRLRGDTRSGFGNIAIEGDRLSLRDHSSISTNALGQTLGSGEINLTLGSLSLTDSSITSDTSTGLAGNVTVTAQQPQGIALHGSRISATGGLGNISLRSPQINLQNQSLLSTDGQGVDTTLSSTALTTAGGNIVLVSDGQLVLDQSRITANALNSNGGEITITVPTVTLDRGSAITTNIAGTLAGNPTGNSGGNIAIATRDLHLTNLSEITSNATGGGAGNITLGQGSQVQPLTVVLDHSRITATGGSGNLNVNSQGAIELRNASLLSTDGQGSQGGGTIGITGKSLVVDGSAITTNALGQGAGSGDLNLRIGSLTLRRNSALTSDASAGSAGNITLTVLEEAGLVLDDSRITATGGSGNLQIQSPHLLLQNQSLLSTNGRGGESGGNINARAGGSVQLRDSTITANADNSFGGQVTVNAPLISLDRSAITTNVLGTQVSPTITGGNISLQGGSVYLQNFSEIASNAVTGGAGNIEITATDPNTLRLRQSRITATGGLGNLTLTSRGNIELLDGSLLSTNGRGLQPGGNISLTTDRFVIGLNNSDITANAENSAGGRVSITTQGLLGLYLRDRLTSGNDITVTSDLGADFSGVLTIQTPNSQVDSGLVHLPQAPLDVSDQIRSGCLAAQGNRFAVVGQGGIPDSPLAPLNPSAGWQDLQNALLLPSMSPRAVSPRAVPDSGALDPALAWTEATGWVRDATGRITLVSQSSPPWLPGSMTLGQGVQGSYSICRSSRS